MTFPNRSFMDGITEIKHAAVQLALDTVEDNPSAVIGIVAQVTNGVFGNLTTNDKFRLMSEVKDVAGIGACTGYVDVEDISSLADIAFEACLDHHLRGTEESIMAAAFAVGFLPAALEAIEIVEMSGETKWMPNEKVQKVRRAYEALASSEGTLADLEDALEAAHLFDKLLEHPKDKVLHQRHHTDSESMGRITRSLKFYRDLLGTERQVAPEALSILSARQRNLPIIEAERERALARRNRTP